MQAIKNFSKAIFIHPVDKELWEEDLRWAIGLLEKKNNLSKTEVDSSLKIIELDDSDAPTSGQAVNDIDNSEATNLHEIASETSPEDTLQLSSNVSLNRLPENYVVMRD